MRVQCSVCKLADDKKAEVDTALRRGDVSLQEISERTGLSRSGLHRHRWTHLNPLPAKTPVPMELAKIPGAIIPTEVISSGETPREVFGPVVPVPESPAVQPVTSTLSKERFLQRIEALWEESWDGLTAAKEPTVLSKPDGSTMTIEGGDLRARAAFIREARGVLELQGEATGDLVKGQPPNVINGVWIVCPANAVANPPTVVIGGKQR